MIQPIQNTMPPLVPSGFLSQTSYASQALPQNNAVKIDIHNPYASNQPAVYNPYAMPQSSAYAPFVAAPHAYPMYAYQPNTNPYMNMPVAQQVVNQLPAMAPAMQTMPTQVAQPMVQSLPVQAPTVATAQTAPLVPQIPQSMMPQSSLPQVAPQVATIPQTATQVPAQQAMATKTTTTQPIIVPPSVVVPQPVLNNQPQIINAPQTPVVIPVPTPVVQTPVVEPAPVITEMTTPAPATANATVNVAPTPVQTVPAPVQVQSIPVANAEAEAAQVKPQVEAPSSTPVNLDLNKVISKLNSTDADAQLSAIEMVAETAQTNTPNAVQLLDTQVMDALGNIIKKDTTQMQAPSPEQLTLRQKMISGEQLTPEQTAEANKLSEMEVAERNKQFALYTIAILQNLLSSEVEKAQGTKLEMKDLPMINDVVKIAKADANPMIRASALAALSYIANAENKPLLTIMFEQSKKDADPNVQAVATEALNKLSQI